MENHTILKRVCMMFETMTQNNVNTNCKHICNISLIKALKNKCCYLTHKIMI